MGMTENEALKRIKMCIGISPSENIISSFEMISDALAEIQQYRAIGTVEEFKALKEKNVAKKVIAKKDGDHTFYFCPKCKIVVGNSFTGHIVEYCKCCGQKLDWRWKEKKMTVNEIIKLLDKEENKYGGATGKERELKISINGEFLGSIESAKLDGWGDGLVTDVTLELKTGKYLSEEEIRAKAIDDYIHAYLKWYETRYSRLADDERIDMLKIAEQMKAGAE